MTWWFDTKLALANSVPAFTFSGQVSKDMGKLSGLLRSFEYDTQTVLRKRRESYKRLLALKEKHEKLKDVAMLRERLDDSEYITEAQRYLKDVKQVIGLLKSVIEDEYLEMVYDVHEALELFRLLVLRLQTVVRMKSLGIEDREVLEEEIADLRTGFTEFIDEVMRLIENDLKLFGNMRVPFAAQLEKRVRKEMELTISEDVALADHIVAKTNIMKELRVKKKQIGEILRRVLRLMRKITIVGTFKQQVERLLQSSEEFLDYSEQRVHLAFEIVRDAVLLQIQKEKELEEMMLELQVLQERKVRGVDAVTGEVKRLEGVGRQLERVEARETRRTLRKVGGLRTAFLASALVLTGMGAKLTDVEGA